MKKTKIGLAGLGRIGKIHLQNLVNRLPQVEVVAVSDVDDDTRQTALQFGVSHFYHEFEAILSHAEIEAVIICSPTSTHLDYIKSAAGKGKHIFCEKPLEMTVDKISEIEEVVNDHAIKLQVGFNRRFDADFMKLKNVVTSGKIGDPHILRITSRDPAPPPVEYIKGSGGLFLDMTIHDFDMARFITGSEVTQVFAQGTVRGDEQIRLAGDIDTAMIQLRFENGTIGAIDNSRKAVYGYDQRVEIFGSKGMAQNKNHFPDTHSVYDAAGIHRPQTLNFFMERYAESYYLEMKAFVDAITENKEVAVGCHDALMATKIAVAAKISMLENRPVDIDIS